MTRSYQSFGALARRLERQIGTLPARSQMVEVHHKTILNGKVLTDEVSWHLGKQLARPPAGPNQALFGLTPSSPATTAAIR